MSYSRKYCEEDKKKKKKNGKGECKQKRVTKFLKDTQGSLLRK